MKNNIGKSYIEYTEEDDRIVVDMLYVAEEDRGNKMGYKLLDTVCKSASKNVELYAESDECKASEWLVEYYREYGFKSNPDHDQDMVYKV